MEFNLFSFAPSFAYPHLLWSLAFIPFVWLLYIFLYKQNRAALKLETFIDPHLLKYLLINPQEKAFSLWKPLFVWSLIWSCLAISLAGPRWSYRDVETYAPDQNLVILLDLSQSMEADDIKPSRIARAKQKIEDLLNQAKGLHIGLIAFAADPHMITPLTQDFKTIKHLLPSLDTNLVFVQGSQLSPALEMANTMLNSSAAGNRAVLVISDGGYEDASALKVAKAMSDKGTLLYTMGVGTAEGSPIRDRKGNFIKKNDKMILSKLEKEKLQELSQIGGGKYLEAHLVGNEESLILNDLNSRTQSLQNMQRKIRIWDEDFYWFLLPILPFALFWLRRGFIMPLFLCLATIPVGLHGIEVDRYFKNSEQLGEFALEKKDYEAAVRYFQDPYRKGVAEYRAGRYAEAEALFRISARPEVEKEAAYNLGNALVHQQKLEESIEQYEKVLAKWPDHQPTKENLEIVKKMLEEKKEQQKNSDSSEQNERPNEETESEQNQGNSKDSDKKQKPEESKEASKDDSQKNDPEDQQPGDKDSDTSDRQQDDANQAKNKQDEREEKLPESGEDEAKLAPSRPENVDEANQDHDADQWLNRMQQKPGEFLKHKFYIESKQKGTKEATDPW